MKKLIGKGAFTKAYLLESGKVELHSCDPVKECMALCGFGDSYLWPSIEQVDNEVYTMDYLPKTPSLKNSLELRQYQLYTALRKLKPLLSFGLLREWEYLDHWRKQFESLPVEFEEEKQALLEAVYSLGNYGQDIQFEISPRNVRAVNGKLCLLDCFFFVSQLKLVNSRKAA